MPSDLYADGAAPRVLLIGAPRDRALIEPVVTASGGRIAGEVDWGEAIADHAAQLVVAAMGDLAGAALAAAVDLLALIADGGDATIVVTLRTNQIDAVAGALIGGDAQLLCDADDAAIAGAVALALARRSTTLVDTVREGEEERLRRLNDEVARIARLLAELSDGDRRSGGVADRVGGFGAPPFIASASPVRATDIRNVIRSRRLRDQHFARGLFEDPAWDMLLDLYAAELEGTRVSVSSLCIAAAVAPTTALRWINRMTEAKLFDRRPDPFDRRRVFLGLSADARDKMDRYFGGLLAAGLPLG